MVNFFVDRIKNCKMTLEEVPPRWRSEVEKKMKDM